MSALEVLFTPADFAALGRRDLGQTDCVVFDVLRATSSMITALADGAEAIIPVAEIPEALEVHRTYPDALLAGERNGVRIPAELAGGTAFDLGNSPREFTPARVRGRRIIMSTTNGTRALRACAGARTVLACAFLNLTRTANWLVRAAPAQLLVVCSGTYEEAAYEDVLGAGALCDLLWDRFGGERAADSAYLARQAYRSDSARLTEAVSGSRNGRRLMGRSELRDDVAFCCQRDTHPVVAQLDRGGMLRRVAQ
ncbi:MAG TPA: 2-phosphosulfolactate phosphatase [Verrucomicrobiae bacterium]|nr:2-phosphosulfolactate phosphatase [Verrucomicrobiae bacterium]